MGIKKPATDSSLKPKEKWELWLSFGNLLVTIIIGVGVAIFLNYRNEKIQKEIIQLQASIDQQLSSQQVEAQKQLIEFQIENERKSELANIQVTELCYYVAGCDGTFDVRNIGPADASDIRIVIYSPYVTDDWLPTIQDLSAFRVRILSPLVDFTVTQTTVDSFSVTNVLSGLNAFEIVVRKLKVDQNFYVAVELSPSLSLKQYETTRFVTIHKTTDIFYLDALRKYFYQQEYPVARFDVDLDCSNCVTKSFLDSIVVSSIKDWHWERVSQSENIDELTVSITYLMPDAIYHIPRTDKIELVDSLQYGLFGLRRVSP